MINRELIRTKIVQLVFAYYMNGGNNLDSAEKELLFSLSKAYELYNVLLSLIVAVTQEEFHRVEIGIARARREGTEEPSMRFVQNQFALQLEDNIQLREYMESRNQTWKDDIDFVRKICTAIEQSDIYKEYMALETVSYEDDREVWRKIYKHLIQNNEELDALLEEKSLYWNDDKEVIDTFVMKTIRRFQPETKDKQELLPEFKSDEDRDFARKLFRATILNAGEYHGYINSRSLNWDVKRLAYMDLILMQVALAEIMTMPNIPINVTINEYVELAKTYSTSKSGGYINGMLDAIARKLIEKGILLKYIDPEKDKPLKQTAKKPKKQEEEAGDSDPETPAEEQEEAAKATSAKKPRIRRTKKAEE